MKKNKKKLFNKFRFKEQEKTNIIYSTLNKYYFKDLDFLYNLSLLDFLHVYLKKHKKDNKIFVFLLESKRFKGYVFKGIPRMTFKYLMKKKLTNGVFKQKK